MDSRTSTTPHLIGLYSPEPQSGKTTVSNLLFDKGYVRVPFAEPLKLMLTPLLEELGYSDYDVERLLYVDKHERVEQLGVTSRHLQQTLGTEWGRTCVSPDMWLRVWKQRMRHYRCVVVDDVRFINEAELIRAMGGEVWHIHREKPCGAQEDQSEMDQVMRHVSEGGLDAWPHFSRYIVNNGTLQELADAVSAIPLR